MEIANKRTQNISFSSSSLFIAYASVCTRIYGSGENEGEESKAPSPTGSFEAAFVLHIFEPRDILPIR